MQDTHALLWSQSQCAMHIEPLSDTLKKNRLALDEDRRMDYVPIALGTPDEVRAVASRLRDLMANRQAAR